MVDDPRPEDPLRTTVGTWDEFGRDCFNKGVQASIGLVLKKIESSNLTKEKKLFLFNLLEDFEKLKK